LGLFGDFIGGPLRAWFGNGIRDREVRARGLLRNWTLLAHLSYWHAAAFLPETGIEAIARDVLVETLDLAGQRLGIPRYEKPSW
jgi:hypothetical protein